MEITKAMRESVPLFKIHDEKPSAALSALSTESADLISLKGKLDNLKKFRDRMKHSSKSKLANKFGSNATLQNVGGQKVLRGNLFKIIDDVRCFMKFQLDYQNHRCDFEIYSKISTRPLQFRIEEIDDCHLFDLRSVLNKMRLINPLEIIVDDDDPLSK